MRKIILAALFAAALCAGAAPAQSVAPVTTTTFVFSGRGLGQASA